MNNLFKRECQTCGENTFSYFDLFKMIDGRAISCRNCKKKFKGIGFWIFLFQILVGLMPIMFVLSIMYYGLLGGSILFIIGFLLVTGSLIYLMPVQKVEIRPKTDVIDNLTKE